MKLDMYYIEENYLGHKTVADSVICINCSYEINELLIPIDKEFSIENIVLHEDYLICEQFQIKKILE